MSDRLGRSCSDPIGGQALGGGALRMPMRVLLVTMYCLFSCVLSMRCWGEWGHE